MMTKTRVIKNNLMYLNSLFNTMKKSIPIQSFKYLSKSIQIQINVRQYFFNTQKFCFIFTYYRLGGKYLFLIFSSYTFFKIIVTKFLKLFKSLILHRRFKHIRIGL